MTKSMENTLNGKGSAVNIPKIIFDPNTVPQAEEPKLNKYGLDLIPGLLKLHYEFDGTHKIIKM